MADFLDMHGVASRLKQYYEGLGITAKEFSERTGISQTTLSSINTGKSNKVNVDSINKAVATCEDLDGYWLLFGEKQRKTDLLVSNISGSDDKDENLGGVDSRYNILLNRIEEQAKRIAELEAKLYNLPESKEIEEIKVYFSDGSYRNYQNTEPK